MLHILNHTIGGGREYLVSYSCGLGGGRRAWKRKPELLLHTLYITLLLQVPSTPHCSCYYSVITSKYFTFHPQSGVTHTPVCISCATVMVVLDWFTAWLNSLRQPVRISAMSSCSVSDDLVLCIHTLCIHVCSVVTMRFLSRTTHVHNFLLCNHVLSQQLASGDMRYSENVPWSGQLGDGMTMIPVSHARLYRASV